MSNKPDRLFVGSDIRDDGAEVWWRAASSGICWPDDNMAHGTILISKSGAMNMQFKGPDGTPYLAVLDSRGFRIVVTEDSWLEGGETDNYELAWDPPPAGGDG